MQVFIEEIKQICYTDNTVYLRLTQVFYHQFIILERVRMSKKKRRKKKRLRWIKFLFEILVLTVLALGLFLAYKYTQITKTTIQEDQLVVNTDIPEDEWNRMKNYTTLALFGVDSRTGALESGANSDTIMVCSINNETKEVHLASVYRDTYLDTTDDEYRKCTEVYSIGGAQQSISMLNKNLDLNITDYVTVNFQALVELVDMFGGVDITLSEGEVVWLNGYLVEEREVLGQECEDVPGPGLQIDTILPMVSTSLSITDMAKLITGIGKYTMDETVGFPFDKKTMDINNSDCVVAVDLAENVRQLHSYLYGSKDYMPSEVVQEISSEIRSVTGIE